MDSTPVPSRSATRAIVVGGLLAGTSDLTFAFIYYGARGASMQRVMQSVAGGLLGKATFDHGAASAALGVGLHYLIAAGAAATYWLASCRWPALHRRSLTAGLAFGAAVYFVMNMVVLPLSAYHSSPFPPPLAPWPIATHMVGVGLPIAWSARRWGSPPSRLAAGA